MIPDVWLETCRFGDYPILMRVIRLSRLHFSLVRNNMHTLAVRREFYIKCVGSMVYAEEKRDDGKKAAVTQLNMSLIGEHEVSCIIIDYTPWTRGIPQRLVDEIKGLRYADRLMLSSYDDWKDDDPHLVSLFPNLASLVVNNMSYAGTSSCLRAARRETICDVSMQMNIIQKSDTTSSEELQALEDAVADRIGQAVPPSRIAVYTRRPFSTKFKKRILKLMDRLFPADGAHLTIQWIPGHCGLDGNEAADRLAGGASTIVGQQQVPVDLSSSKAAVKRRMRERWKQTIAHNYYEHKKQASRMPKVELSVAEQRILSQLRCNGHCPLLQTYKARIGVDPNATCPSCRMEDETAEHCLLRCPATEQVRIQLFGHHPTLSILWEDPSKVIEFLRSIGRLDGHRQRL